MGLLGFDAEGQWIVAAAQKASKKNDAPHAGSQVPAVGEENFFELGDMNRDGYADYALFVPWENRLLLSYSRKTHVSDDKFQVLDKSIQLSGPVKAVSYVRSQDERDLVFTLVGEKGKADRMMTFGIQSLLKSAKKNLSETDSKEWKPDSAPEETSAK
jgi:hypothetical protein